MGKSKRSDRHCTMKLIFSFLVLVGIQTGVLSLDCLTCKAKPSNPLRCTRPEHDGTYKTCEQGATHCFKSVDKKTQEVNKGCIGPDEMVAGSKTSQQEMFLCSKRLCNSASLPGLSLLSVATLLLSALVLS